MSSFSDEKMTELIIGEAVTELLNDNAAITWSALLDKLHAIAASERDEERAKAALMAIGEVRAEMGNSKTESDNPLSGIPARHQMH